MEDQSGIAYIFLHNDVCIKFYNLTHKFLEKVKHICLLTGSKYEFYERKYTNNMYKTIEDQELRDEIQEIFSSNYTKNL